MLPKKEEIRDKVVLVGLNSPVLREDSATEESMDELSALVETAGGETAGIVLQNRPAPDPRTFIGEGKVAEVQLYVENVGATMVIFDNDLSPSQQRVLTELLGVQVLDRCGLILDIFAQRAKTKEGRLQVELAQYRYLLPRLIGMWSHLERQGGTSGKGMTLLFEAGHGDTQDIPLRLIPLVMVSTWLTHLFGGSAGREGVAVQIGGTLAHSIGKRLPIPNAGKQLLLTGMAAGFAGLFRTPIAATFFALEVLTAGVLEYSALLPALVASFSASAPWSQAIAIFIR